MDNLNKKFLMEYIDEIQGELRDISDKDMEKSRTSV